jgi:hypothetical protein
MFKKWAQRLGWGLVFGFVLWYAGASALAGANLGIKVLDRADCRALESYLAAFGEKVRVEAGSRFTTENYEFVVLQLKLPDGRVVLRPLFLGPLDNSRTLAGEWPEQEFYDPGFPPGR